MRLPFKYRLFKVRSAEPQFSNGLDRYSLHIVVEPAMENENRDEYKEMNDILVIQQ